jgi:hypothetical protein
VRGWEGIPPHELVLTDYHKCVWPPPLSTKDDSIARRFDAINDECDDELDDKRTSAARPATLEARCAALRKAHPHAPLISTLRPAPRLPPTQRAAVRDTRRSSQRVLAASRVRRSVLAFCAAYRAVPGEEVRGTRCVEARACRVAAP